MNPALLALLAAHLPPAPNRQERTPDQKAWEKKAAELLRADRLERKRAAYAKRHGHP